MPAFFSHLSRRAVVSALGAALGFLALPAAAPAQGTGGPVVSDSKVGYIDSAIPADMLRLRYDPTYGNLRPSRAEFFYARTDPPGPGLKLPERRVDYQDLTAYAETALFPNLSAFVELPVRFLNPDLNPNTGGMADMNAGFKLAFIEDEARVVSFQLRTYAPTGDADRGLGTNHISLEPALLFHRALSDRVCLEGELRYWIPIGGTDFAGDVIRYGLGLGFDVIRTGHSRVSLVTEFVGWTVLGGKSSQLFPSGVVRVQDATGDTIVNGKVGVRFGLSDRMDFFTGWGRPVTGERWYDNVLRLELRLLF